MSSEKIIVDDIKYVKDDFYGELTQKAKSIQKRSIIAIICTLLLITIPVAIILTILNVVKMNSTDWKNPELNSLKSTLTIFSIVGFILTIFIGPIITLVFAIQALNKYNSLTIK